MYQQQSSGGASLLGLQGASTINFCGNLVCGSTISQSNCGGPSLSGFWPVSHFTCPQLPFFCALVEDESLAVEVPFPVRVSLKVSHSWSQFSSVSAHFLPLVPFFTWLHLSPILSKLNLSNPWTGLDPVQLDPVSHKCHPSFIFSPSFPLRKCKASLGETSLKHE